MQFNRLNERRLKETAEKLIDIFSTLKSYICPRCCIPGYIEVKSDGGHVRYSCYAPVNDSISDDGMCGYDLIVYCTTIAELPEPRFLTFEPKPKPTRTVKAKPKAKSRRSARGVALATK